MDVCYHQLLHQIVQGLILYHVDKVEESDDDDDYENEDEWHGEYDYNDNHLRMLSMTVSRRAVSRSGLSRLAPS